MHLSAVEADLCQALTHALQDSGALLPLLIIMHGRFVCACVHLGEYLTDRRTSIVFC